MEYLLDPEIVFLNHGSYGACPVPVFERYQALQRELERNPVEFLGRRFDTLLEEARSSLAAFVGARPEDLVFVPNATAGLNAVIRSLRLGPDDEVLTTRHEYGAVIRTWEFMGVRLVYAEPDEVVDAIGPRTRVVSVSHITSPTALLVPVEEICAAARRSGALAVVDGAHAPGHVPLDLKRLGADVYAGNCHKWLSAPKGAGFCGHGRSTSAGSSPSWSRGATAQRRVSRTGTAGRGRETRRRHSLCPPRSRRTVRSTSSAAAASRRPSTTACRRSGTPLHRRCGRPSYLLGMRMTSSGGSSPSTGSRCQ